MFFGLWIIRITTCTLVTPPPPSDHLHVSKVIHKSKEKEVQILRTRDSLFLMAVTRFEDDFFVCVTVWVAAKRCMLHPSGVFDGWFTGNISHINTLVFNVI